VKPRGALISGLVVLAFGLSPGIRAEIHADRPSGAFDGVNGAPDAVTRRIVVNGIATLGSSWTVNEDLPTFAARALAASKLGKGPLPPRSKLDESGLTLVQFLTAKPGDRNLEAASAHVMMAKTGMRPGELSVWAADIPMAGLIHEARERAKGVAPGRDHPALGAIAGAQRVNVVEVIDHGYSYNAVYQTAGAPEEVMRAVLANLTARGAHVDGQMANLSDARAALSMPGGRIDFSVIRNPDTTGSRIVIQTDIPPNIQVRESR
jgi:hypothetical protein